jgi:hypothetical protein
MSGKALLLAIVVSCLCGAAVAYAQRPAFEVDARAGGLTFAKDFPAADRAWVLAALARARPEARRLIDEIDGRTTVTAFYAPNAWLEGRALPGEGPGPYVLRLNLARLDGERVADRDAVVLHELGHLVDYGVVEDGLRDALADAVPLAGVCPEGFDGDCAVAPERFADTFAKWALRGAVSAVGAGYHLPAPRSLEDWGAPLSALAIQLDVAAR